MFRYNFSAGAFVLSCFLLFTASCSAAGEKERPLSLKDLVESCEKALKPENDFDSSFCRAYIEGYMGASRAAGYTAAMKYKGIPLKRVGEPDSPPEPAEEKECKKEKDLGQLKTTRDIAEYIVKWTKQNIRFFQEKYHEEEAGDSVYMVLFDERYCDFPLKGDVRSGDN